MGINGLDGELWAASKSYNTELIDNERFEKKVDATIGHEMQRTMTHHQARTMHNN